MIKKRNPEISGIFRFFSNAAPEWFRLSGNVSASNNSSTHSRDKIYPVLPDEKLSPVSPNGAAQQQTTSFIL